MSGHPYEPQDLVLEGYQSIHFTPTTILGVFFAVWASILFLLISTLRAGYRLKWTDCIICCWLVLSGLTHLVVEGPVVWNENFYREPPGHFVNELWKEYGKADSRYLTRDACTIGIEAITVFVEGPICLLLVIAFIQKQPWRQVLTILVVTGELYGTVLYFLTSFYDDFIYQRKEWLYFWFYFVGMNSIWIVCPLLVIWKMTSEISTAMRHYDKANGSATISKKD